MPQKTQNFRERAGQALAGSKKRIVEALKKRLGPPPESVAGPGQKNDAYRAYWKLGKGWEDPSTHVPRAAAMYAQGAKPADVLKAMYPDRVELIPFGDRADDLEAQVKFCDEMVAQHMEELANAAVSLRDQMNDEGGLNRV